MPKQILSAAALTAAVLLSPNWGGVSMLAMPTSATQAANGSCSGTVTDANGEPVIGANVKVDGTNMAVTTDIDGRFSFANVNTGAKITITSIGFTPKTVVWNGQPLSIVLDEEANALDEVVVVGYGVQKKVNLTGAVATVDGKTLESRPITSVSTALQGMMPGVQVTASGNGGAPGMDGGTIRVRGTGTMNNSNPYILVDGVETGTINTIDPNDIESISVLKDAASAAIYGSKASNGVILITTKKGATGKPTVNYSGNVGFIKPTSMIERMGSYEYATLLNQALVDGGRDPRFSDEALAEFQNGTRPNTDWYDEAYKDGFITQHNISVSGGTENVTYSTSFGYLLQDGILNHSNRRQFNGRANIEAKINDHFTARTRLSYINNRYNDPNSSYAEGSYDQIIRQLNIIAPWIEGRNEDGTYGTVGDGNPLAWLDYNGKVKRIQQNFTGTVGLDYKIIDGLVFTANATYVSQNNDYNRFRAYIVYNPNKVTDPAALTETFVRTERASFDGLLNFNRNFGLHGLSAMAGYHAEHYTYKYNAAARTNFPSNDINDMDAGSSSTQTNGGYTRELNMISWFGRVNYDYAGKYLLEANVRADASSRFADGYRWGTFPSFSAGWRISEESFMEELHDVINNAKLRASWGKLGNQDALDDYYPWLTTYNINYSYPLGGSLQTGYGPNGYSLATISWEKATTWGVGLDLNFLNNQFGLSVDYYDRKTTGIIMGVPVPSEFGLGSYYANVGGMVNRGVEISANINKQWGDWNFWANANFSYNHNEVQDLGYDDAETPMYSGSYRQKVGEAYNSYYTYKSGGLFQSDAEAQAYMDKYYNQAGYPFAKRTLKGGDIIIEDVNGDGKIDADDRTNIGTRDPKYTYGLSIGAGWKGFDFSAIFAGAADFRRMVNYEVVGEFTGDTSHPSTAWRDAWSPSNTDGKMPRVAYTGDSNSTSRYIVSDFWVRDASYLRCKNMQLGYTIPKNLLKKADIKNLRVYISAENLFTIHNDLLVNVDPEISSDRGSSYLLTKTFSFGVNLSF